MKRPWPLVFVLLVSVWASAVADPRYIVYPSTPAPLVRPPKDCLRYVHGDCKNWRIGEWLPYPHLDPFERWREHKAANVNFMDGFIYEGTIPHGPGWAALQGQPADGTPFSYGTAGPPRGNVVYDYGHAIAFYSQGCCAWHSTVLASHVIPPPLHVVNRILTKLQTTRGIVLGDDVQRVQSVYGKTTSQQVASPAGMTIFSYAHMTSSSCGQFQTFGFLHGQLVFVELTNAC